MGFFTQDMVSAIGITSGAISTSGAGSPGVAALDSGPININSTAGLISTSGTGSAGIFSMSKTQDGTNDIVAGPINTTGGGAIGIAAAALSSPVSPTPSASLSIQSNGAIVASGPDAGGIVAVGFATNHLTSGPVTVVANNNITATGDNSVGIAAASGTGHVQVEVSPGVSVMGGFSSTPGALSTQASTFGFDGESIGGNLPAAGIVVYSGATSSSPAMTIVNHGFVGALNDRAITMGFACASENGADFPGQDPCVSGMPPIQQLQVENQGTITGYVTFLPGAPHVFDNAGLFDVRNFADTNGDGIRDTKSVAISDFGGPGATFNNLSTGTVRLATVTGAANVDATNYFVPQTGVDNRPLDASVYDLHRDGIVQGQFVNLATFDNQGVIDLRGPAVGNTLIITGGPGVVGGALQPGNGTFVTGGSLFVNSVLNSGMPPGGNTNSLSDVLVVDSTTIGAGGATRVSVTNVGGTGAQTTGNGIEIVQVTNMSASANGAFTLANPELRAGAFDYRLFHDGVGADATDGNWYLRSTMIEPPIPPLPPGPIIGPELATYGVVQPMAQQLGRAMLGTHDDRLGDLYPVPCEPAAPIYTKAPPLYTKAQPVDCGTDGFRPAIWGRLFGQQIDNHYQAFADPRTDGQVAGMQVGFDVLRSDSLIAGHKDYGGLYFAYGNANVDVSGLVTNAAATANVLQHTGALNLNAYSGGAYWTHYGVPGWYLDLVLQGTSYNGGASTEFAALKTTGSGFISSLEGGYPIALPVFGPGFVLEPQAQVLWQWVGFDAGNDGLGPVALGTTSETTARLGVKGKWTIVSDSGQVWQPYVRANVWSDFGDTAVTMFGPDSVPLISHAQYMDVDAGFTTKINAHFSAYAEAGYQFAVSNDGGGKRDGVKGTAGLRYQW